MRRLDRGFVAAFLLFLGVPLAGATTVVVPDDVAGIQAAIDLLPDTVVVRSGAYPERPVIMNDLVLRGVGPTRPQVDGLELFIPLQQFQIVVEGIHVRGPASLLTGDEVTEYFVFRSCVFDSGFVQVSSDVNDVESMEFTACRISGEFAPYATYFFTFVGNVADGPVRLRGSRLFGLDVRDNVIQAGVDPPPGPFAAGLSIESDEVEGVVSGNRIKGFPLGLVLPDATQVTISDNRIENCASYGMVLGLHNLVIDRNVILRCGTGVSVSAAHVEMTGNVIGRSSGDAIQAFGQDFMRLLSNTLYLNGGHGVAVDTCVCPSVMELDRNIGYGNGGYGATGLPANTLLACNDWFGNATGSVYPQGPGPTDLAMDPLFCSVVEDSVHLRAGSLLLDPPECALMGARGEGCPALTASPPLSPSIGLELGPARPQPSAGDVQLRFSLPYAAAIELTVLDVQGRIVARLAEGQYPEGAHSIAWSGKRASAAMAPGVYFVRLRHPAGERTRTVLRIR